MKLNATSFATAVLAALALSSGGASAGVIDNSGMPWRCLCAPASLGQSFTAQDSSVSLTVFGGDANTHLGATLQFHLDFRAGDGIAGALLASFDFSPALLDFNPKAFTFDLSSIPLVVGNKYSFILSSANRRGLTGISQSTSTYAGGRAFDGTTGADFGTTDMAFIVTPKAPANQALPEPASLALVGLGLGLAALSRRRQA